MTCGHVLLTGGAGFIGSHLAETLLKVGWRVTVVDNFDKFYSPALKMRNVLSSFENAAYKLVYANICDLASLSPLRSEKFDAIVHLAAKAGVRPSIDDPQLYQAVNVSGTQNLLEFARESGIEQFVFASSSSVYGVNPNVPWRESDFVLKPISPYASTKVSGELLGHVYSHLYGIRFIALRFFTVYGPRQRPDLAISKFSRMALRGEAIPVFGNGSTRRDYTYIADIVSGIHSALSYKKSSYEIVNLGTHRAISLSELIGSLEQVLGRSIEIRRLPMQPGDVPETFADTSKAAELLGYHPNTTFQDGLAAFIRWLQFDATAAATRDLKRLREAISDWSNKDIPFTAGDLIGDNVG